MLPIEDNVPIPTKQGRGRPPIYPLHQMRVGDSFLVPTDGARASNQRKMNAVYSRQIVKDKKITIRCRSVEGGVRVWRIE
jgi:hypothetical protein